MDTYAFAPARPALRYYGGGWTRAPWTISHFPAHDAWFDLCFGAGSVTFRKPPVQLEVACEVDLRVRNFFQQVRDNCPALLEKINLTPWTADELLYSTKPSDDKLEDARRFFATSWMSVHGAPTAQYGTMRFVSSVDTRYSVPCTDTINRDDLLVVSQRLKNIHFPNHDAFVMIQKLIKSDGRFNNSRRLVYFDPPYVQSTRVRKNGYSHEVTAAWHRYGAWLLRQLNGYVVVAGYRSRLYERCYENYGWQRVEREQQTNGGSKRIECLWLNPRTQAALAAEAAARRPLSLFDYMEDGA